MNKLCSLCPSRCKVDRTKSHGACGSSAKIKIAKYYLHPFEEPPISGTKGSGTIFFTGCSLKCVFCQNFELSRNLRGKEISETELAEIFKALEEQGAHNINLVNPTHYSDKIVNALKIYRPNIPIVYNTHGYEEINVLKEIDPYIDVYLPDIKFFSPELSFKYTGKKNYFEKASKAIEFMANKPIKFDASGLMQSGTIVRHLVLPCGVENTKNIIDWFVKIKDKAYFNLMSQYTPFGDIENYPELKRKITNREYQAVLDYLISKGIENGFFQDKKSAKEEYIPSWDY